jgi:hypothetical protein
LGALERYFIEKNSKNKKTQQQQFRFIFFWVESLENAEKAPF